jgi:gallate decarboxylase subunit D
MRRFAVRVKKGRFTIQALVQEIGNDLLVAIWGGTRPHIGAVGVALPRPSLEDPRKWSATSSNFTFQGHKEDLLAKQFSERISAALRRNVVVTAGIHWDGLDASGIQTIQRLSAELAERVVLRLTAGAKPRPGRR